MANRPTRISLEPDRRRLLAAELFNYVWTLLENEQRTQRETELMIAAAYASRFFWEEDGEPSRQARGEWQISRTCAAAGRAAAAREHAQACLALCEAHELGPFDLGYAHEALARAHLLAGEDEAAAESVGVARSLAPQIEQREDRELLIGDLAQLQRE